MKNLLFLLLVALNAFAQKPNINLKPNEDVVLTTGWYPTVTTSNNSRIIINGDVDVDNFNLNGSTSILVMRGSSLSGGPLHLNGSDTLYANGTVSVRGIELQNGSNFLSVMDGKVYVEGDLQLNDNSGISVCGDGELHISNYLNIQAQASTGAFTLCNCGSVYTYGANINKADVIEGSGSFTISRGNINARFTNSTGIYLNTSMSSNNWGKAKFGVCTDAPLPVKIITEKIDKEGWYIEFADLTELDYFEVEESTDADVWHTVVPKVENNRITPKYSGNL